MKKKDYLEHHYFTHTEPRLGYIQKQIESLLQLVILEKDGQAVDVDGFRLKNLEDWRLKLPMAPLTNLGTFSGFCDCKCQFCIEKGNPPGLIPYCSGRKRHLTIEEVSTRIKYFDAKNKLNLPRINVQFMEPFMNPQYLEILRKVKETYPETFLWVETNGAHLTEAVIEEIAEMGVDELLISLNSASASVRKELMGDPQPEIAINAVRLLKQYRVPYTGSIVPWPTVPFEDMIETARYLDENDALSIRVYLPSFSKHHPEAGLFDETYLKKAIEVFERLRNILDTPVTFAPSLLADQSNLPKILGVVKNSPAQMAGLEADDVILQIGSYNAQTHFEANYYMEMLQNEPFEMQVNRNGEVKNISVQPADTFKYPYTRRVADVIYPTGIVIHDGFQLTDLRRLVKILVKSKAKSVLFLSSRIMKPLFEEQLRRFCDFDEVDFRVEVPTHQFWGGNIMVGGVYVISDFVAHVKRMKAQEGYSPDLIVIPSSPLSEWGKDLKGDTYTELERQVGIPVEMLQTQQWLW